ncbi:MAG: VOC family protein, partial [Mesorhizobium sp.]
MEPRISIITVATDDLDRATRFYEGMGLARHQGITEGVAFFQMGGAILGLFPRESAEEDSGVSFAKAPSAVYLAY